jgi:two-component system, NtrC family, sensor kinase
MKRHKSPKARRRKATAPERPNAPKAARSNKSRAAREETEVARLSRERDEALEQQAATSEVLKVISQSTFDLQAVLATLVRSAGKLCQAENVQIFLYDGEFYRLAADNGFSPEYQQYAREHPIKPGRNTLVARTALEGKTVHIPDALADPEYTYGGRTLGGYRTLLGVPLLRDKNCLGVIALTRSKVDPFTNNQVALITNFAAQAVIAVENTRLFNETREALERQTATADILRVIASSPDDVQPVFQAIADRSNRLVDALSTTAFRLIDGMLHLQAFTSITHEADAKLQAAFPAPLSSFPWGEAIGKGEIYRVIDAEQAPELLRDLARGRGWRSALLVPLLREGTPIGMIGPTRAEPGQFSDHHVQLMQTFADQAVIAIENVRLFKEVQARTRELSEALTYQTGSSNILKVIASSPTDVRPALQAIVESACEICEANDAVVLLREEDNLSFSAHHGPIPIGLEKWPINRNWITGRAVVDKVTQYIQDVLGPEGEEFPEAREMFRRQGFRTVLCVPLLREGESIGAITLRRNQVQSFDDKQIELLKSFADQAVIAISNVRLFEQVQQRTRELSQSLDDLRAAQDRLIQTEKLASLGQLTAGIAHEIKNPLNFVNNFSALSVELTDELNDLMKQATLAEQLRKEVDEVTGLLKGNLEKVVQHGKRADSIVKNMLQHSHEGSGEQRSTDINAIVEDSLNLAYHGARAEKSGFTITLRPDFAPDAGAAELYPQEITRALLNLISNGFYAATRRKVESADEGFEPVLSASTRNLGKTVEIRIRDNGAGIPPEVKEKMFVPFFTTKPTGEGTGLGLSMTHDIIVKQHGGRIDVETEPGAFTEFIITLPRGNGGPDRSEME